MQRNDSTIEDPQPAPPKPNPYDLEEIFIDALFEMIIDLKKKI